MSDPYEILGVQRGASEEEIKKAYKRDPASLSTGYEGENNRIQPKFLWWIPESGESLWWTRESIWKSTRKSVWRMESI